MSADGPSLIDNEDDDSIARARACCLVNAKPLVQYPKERCIPLFSNRRIASQINFIDWSQEGIISRQLLRHDFAVIVVQA
jgi:hypothetical protein